MGVQVRGGKNSQWLMASGIKRPHLHHWTIHYCEVDILLCQPMVLNEGCRYWIQVLSWKELGQFGTSSKTLMDDRIGNTQYRRWLNMNKDTGKPHLISFLGLSLAMNLKILWVIMVMIHTLLQAFAFLQKDVFFMFVRCDGKDVITSQLVEFSACMWAHLKIRCAHYHILTLIIGPDGDLYGLTPVKQDSLPKVKKKNHL